MNLDELKTRLAEQNAKLDQVLRLNAAAIRDLQVAKTKSSLRWLAWGVALELAVTLVAVVWLGNFITEYWREPKFLLPAVLLDVCGIALVGTCIRQLITIARVNYGDPVVAVQKELGKLRVLRIRTTKWTMILSFVLWFPVLIVLFRGLLGVDIWMILGAIAERDGAVVAWMVGNVAFGLVAALALMWLWNRYAHREDRSSAMRRLMDDFAGSSLTKALNSLDAIVRFETEPLGAGAARSET